MVPPHEPSEAGRVGKRRSREPFELCRLRQRETWFVRSDEVEGLL